MTVRFPATLGALALAHNDDHAAAQTPSAPAAPARTPAAPSASLPPAKKPTVSPDAAAKEGRALFAKFVEALGGTAKVRSVHDLWSRGLVSAKTAQGELPRGAQPTMLFPARSAQRGEPPPPRMPAAPP